MAQFIRNYLDVIWQFCFYLALLFSGWSAPGDILIIYAIETILIGLFHAFRMIVLSLNARYIETDRGIGLTLFFLVHYNLFTFIQTGFFFTFLASSDQRISEGFGLENLWTVLHFQRVQWAIAVLFVSLLVRLYFNFLRPANYRDIEIEQYMFVPYLRIFVQQFVAIIPGFFVMFFDGGYAAAVLLIALRSALDGLLVRLRLHPGFAEKCVDYLMKQSAKQGEKADRSEIRKFLETVVNY